MKRFDIYRRMVLRSAGATQLYDGMKFGYVCAFLETRSHYPEFIMVAKDHFTAHVSPCMAMFEFHKQKQETDETVDEYLTASRMLVMEPSREYLGAPVGEGCVSEKIQQEQFAIMQTTLEQVLGVMRAMNETTRKESKQAQGRPYGSVTVKRVGGQNCGKQRRVTQNPTSAYPTQILIQNMVYAEVEEDDCLVGRHAAKMT